MGGFKTDAASATTAPGGSTFISGPAQSSGGRRTPPTTTPHASEETLGGPTTVLCWGIELAEGEEATALPLLHGVNSLVNALKESINNGERGCSCKKAGAYLGFRIITYTGLPLVFNLISFFVSGILTILLLPTACCSTKAVRWAWIRFEGSSDYLCRSLFDLTTDLRMLTGLCCCPPDSAYIQI